MRASARHKALPPLQAASLPQWRRKMIEIYCQVVRADQFCGFDLKCRRALEHLGLDEERIDYLEAQWWLGSYADAHHHSTNRRTMSQELRTRWGVRRRPHRRVPAHIEVFVADMALLLEDLGVPCRSSDSSVMVRALTCMWDANGADSEAVDFRPRVRRWVSLRRQECASASRACDVAFLRGLIS
jgi:hypothetical protein